MLYDTKRVLIGYTIFTILIAAIGCMSIEKKEVKVSEPKQNFDIVFVEPEVPSYDEKELECLTLNVYFEARNQQTDEAMAAIAYTTMNRVQSSKYPNTICGVVFQGKKTKGGNFVKNKCQFSWVCDGIALEKKLAKINHNKLELAAYERAKRIATLAMMGVIPNPVKNATMYHASYVSPYWKNYFNRIVKIEDHVFYG